MIWKMWGSKPENAICVFADDLDKAFVIAHQIDASINLGQMITEPTLKTNNMLTIQEWLIANTWTDGYICTYGEDQLGCSGSKGRRAFNCTPSQFYVMGVLWHWSYTDHLYPELIITSKSLADEKQAEEKKSLISEVWMLAEDQIVLAERLEEKGHIAAAERLREIIGRLENYCMEELNV